MIHAGEASEVQSGVQVRFSIHPQYTFKRADQLLNVADLVGPFDRQSINEILELFPSLMTPTADVG